jgi:hypothetical protein
VFQSLEFKVEHKSNKLATKNTNFKQKMKDLLAKPFLDYQTNNSPEDLITETTISEEDEMSVAYLFRPTKKCHYGTKLYNLPKERFWMGCGAEAIVVLTERIEFRVTAIDISSNAIQACRGIKDACTGCHDIRK